jgi:uncharacterized alpha-E superfamily protein
MLLSRLATSCYWLGRHLERAADLSGALLAYEQIRLDMPGPEAPNWVRLAALAGLDLPPAGDIPAHALIQAVVLDRENPSSVLGSLHQARENLRRVRFLFPYDCWQTLTPLYLSLTSPPAAAVATDPWAELGPLLAEVVRGSQQFAGQIATGMQRDQAHGFLRIGIHVERADMMFRVSTVMAEALIPTRPHARFEDVRWMGLLKSVGAYHTYRRRFQARSDFDSALELLLFEPCFPRSFAHALLQIDRDLIRLPRNLAAREALRRCWPKAEAASRAALEHYAEAALGALAHLHTVIESSYLSLSSPTAGAQAASPNRDARPAGPARPQGRMAADQSSLQSSAPGTALAERP